MHNRTWTRRGAVRGPLGFLLGGLFFAFAGAMLIAIVAPDIRNDLHIRDTARPASSVRVVEARCRSRALVVQDCRVTMAAAGSGEALRTATYIFVGLPANDVAVRPMADRTRSDMVTTDFGLDRLTARLLTIGGVFVACMGFILAAAVGALRA